MGLHGIASAGTRRAYRTWGRPFGSDGGQPELRFAAMGVAAAMAVINLTLARLRESPTMLRTKCTEPCKGVELNLLGSIFLRTFSPTTKIPTNGTVMNWRDTLPQ